MLERDQKIGKWIIIDFAYRNECYVDYWFAECECGRAFAVKGSDLRNGRSFSCHNCSSIKHGHTTSPEYRIRDGMIQRCTNSNSDRYKDYGGRGIKVCKRWREDFCHFLADMGERPSSRYTLDRIDNDGDYEPDNCRWATRKQQMRNYRDNVFITYDGKTQTIAEWAEELGIKYMTLYSRLRTNHWTLERALQHAPVDRRLSNG